MRLTLCLTFIAMSLRAASPMETVKPTLDVGIIVSDIEKSKAFYGGVLGLRETAPMKLPDGTTMTRYVSGTSTIKLRAFPNADKHYAGNRAAIEIQLVTLYFTDVAPILKRWTDGGHAAPKMTDGLTKGSKYGFLADPDGNRIEIVGMPPEVDVVALDKIAIGLKVAEVERSRQFYGKLLGLTEEEPVTMAGGGKEYRFLAGKTEIKFWADPGDSMMVAGGITNILGIRYFTFLVKEVDSLAAEFKKRGAYVVREPYDLGSIARIMMIADPDGNVIEFAARQSPAR
jgi:predicted enzyme related to lactoylglutathione lyase